VEPADEPLELDRRRFLASDRRDAVHRIAAAPAGRGEQACQEHHLWGLSALKGHSDRHTIKTRAGA
jgi:hypothetical protein